MHVNLGHSLARSEIYGPGVRSVLWLQGCTLACKGCWNTQFWSARGGTQTDVSSILAEWEQQQGLEGVTLLGGEPFQQLEATEALINGAKRLGLTVFVYTGYTMDEFSPAMERCFLASDIVVTGRYLHTLRDTTLRWRGSSNQEVHFPTGHYRHLEVEEQHEVEVHISETGELEMFGYAPRDLIEVLG